MSRASPPLETESKKKHLPTIGIVGFKAMDVAKLNKKIVEYCNSLDFSDDQQHPNLIAIAIATDNHPSHLQDCAKICADYGCDIVAIADKKGGSTLDETITRAILIPVLMLEEGAEKNDDAMMAIFAEKIVDEALLIEESVIKRPDLVYKDTKSKTEEGDINLKIEKDELTTKKRLAKSAETGNHAALSIEGNKSNIAVIIGGAGPLASADLAVKLAESGVNFIHLSVNCAPGKHRFETEQGPSYIRHYQAALNFAQNLLKDNVGSFIIPCNTAHLRLDEIFKGHQQYLKKIIDLRYCVLSEESKKHEKLFLLGTKATTRPDKPEDGNYEKYRADNFADFDSFIVPNEEQQKEITDAIFKVKAGKMDEAKQLILKVAKELKKTHGIHPLVLGCTELPLPFTIAELAENSFIDPIALVAKKAKTMAIDPKQRSNNYNEPSETLDASFLALRTNSDGSRSSSSGSSSPTETEINIDQVETLAKFTISCNNGKTGKNLHILVATKNVQTSDKDLHNFCQAIASKFHSNLSHSIKFNRSQPTELILYNACQTMNPELKHWLDENKIQITDTKNTSNSPKTTKAKEKPDTSVGSPEATNSSQSSQNRRTTTV